MDRRMIFQEAKISGVYIVKTKSIRDNRGTFTRWFCGDDLSTFITGKNIVQINHSCTHDAGVVRGLHFQNPPYAEMKLIRCIRGRVWDVVVDIRKNSPTYLQWYAEEISADNMKMMVIPEGCAHGFQVLEPNSELLYLHTAFYTPKAENGLNPQDPYINISWPLPIKDISDRDKSHPMISETFQGVSL